jgi:DNA-binding MarR family transcriptional regulator
MWPGMPRAPTPEMHFMSFALKRAHLRLYATARAWHPRSPITAARYDILHAIQEGHCIFQSTICRALGLSGATISRAVRRLEELGLVARYICSSDRRRKWLQLTKLGLAEFRRIAYHTVAQGLFDMAYECALGPPTEDTWFYLDDSYRAVLAIAGFFGDTSKLRYPTGHPDD